MISPSFRPLDAAFAIVLAGVFLGIVFVSREIGLALFGGW